MMNLISNATIRMKLIYIGLIALVSVFMLVGTSKYVINSIKIGSPTYTKIVNSKDLLADILPPPVYIIEARLITLTLLQPRSPEKVNELIAKLGKLEKDISDRKVYWDKNLNNEKLHSLLEPSYTSGMEYFKVLNNDFIPAIKSNDKELATELAIGKLEEIYKKHRACIDNLVTQLSHI